jgi:ribosome-binding factor A
MAQVRRADRVARLIQDELSNVVRKDVKDSRVENVTFTRVEMASDLRRGTVFFVPLGGLGDAERVKALQGGLDSARGFIEQRVFKNLRLRSRPRFAFKYDSGVQNLVEVHEVLQSLAPAPAPPEPEEEEV